MAKQRGNGSGSTSPYKDSWRPKWMMPDGSRKSKVMGNTSETAALRRLNEIIIDVACGDYEEAPTRRVRFDAFAKEYLAAREPLVTVGTHKNWESLLRGENWESLLRGTLKPFEKVTPTNSPRRPIDIWWSRRGQHVLTLIQDLNERGIRIQSVGDGLDSTMPTGKAMLQMLAIFAELERSFIRERTTARPRRRQGAGPRGRPCPRRRRGDRPRGADAPGLG